MSTPDIEIYVQNASADAVLAWLALRFPASAETRARSAGKRQWRIVVQEQDKGIPVLIIEGASAGFTSIWFDSAHTPWEDDIACAREAHTHFKTAVRAIAGSWQEGDDPDAWWHIDDKGEGVVNWPG